MFKHTVKYASYVAHMHNMPSSAHECILAKLILGTRTWEYCLCFKLQTTYLRNDDMDMDMDMNSMTMQLLHTSWRLCLLPALFWNTHMISDTQNKQASAQQHDYTALYNSAAFDLNERIQSTPCMAHLQQYKTHTILADTSSRKLT